MTTLLAVPEVAVPELPDGDEMRLFDGEPTLEERVAGAWERLAAGQPPSARCAAARCARAGRPAPASSAAAATAAGPS